MAEILIVEDETAINELLRRNLELVGHRCRSVYDGEAAVEVLEEQAFDLMLLDIMLPGQMCIRDRHICELNVTGKRRFGVNME